ncbi:hypothetical protein [Pedobacter sp. SG908]|uniref:hypothetical protein n=1 Tax=Pedobacter sp. SG908 TaxID=2587135 RepID=UPI001423A9AE|nr:hypothetical protein [Pedobacter sp. SG908]NII83294.1 hypothetical protein [Pedobacter sp. SG908]
MKFFLLSLLLCSASIVMAQPQVVTTGNNVINASNPYAADVVIGSDAAGGTRHDSSIMWWSNLSASRISNTGNSFNFSVWATPQTPNASISSEIGGTSYMMGNFGIGTNTPAELLEIRANQPVITFHQPNISSFKMGTSNGVFKLLAMDNGFGGHTGNFSDTNNPYVFSFLQNGNVGIGTSEANEKLVVNGNLKLILDQGTFPSKNVVNIVSLGYSGITGAKNWALRSVYQYGNGVGNNADGGDLDVIKSLNGSTILATKTDGTALGNVGIGTTNPTDMLTVAGKIGAREIKVSTNAGADFVFESDYKLTDLNELEKFVKTNKHLPEIPTAKQMVDNGVNLGELNIKLLQKVEELTLHLIEKDKNITQLTEQLKSQAEMLKAFAKQLKTIEESKNTLKD